jgi:hypothetical protein
VANSNCGSPATSQSCSSNSGCAPQYNYSQQQQYCDQYTGLCPTTCYVSVSNNNGATWEPYTSYDYDCSYYTGQCDQTCG